MNTRKSMKLPIIITFLIIAIIVYLFATIKQTKVTCVKNNTYDDNIHLNEEVETIIDGRKIKSIKVTKTIILPEKYTKSDTYLNSIKYALDNTLEYLGDKVNYTIGVDRIVVKIEVDSNETILLDNIDFIVNNDLQIVIDSNIKSNNSVTLSIGDNYTDGELMKKLKNNGFSCK